MEKCKCQKCLKKKSINKFPDRKDSATGKAKTCIQCRTEMRSRNLNQEDRLRIDSRCHRSAMSVWNKANPA